MTTIVLDCDPGFDDAVAILVLLACAESRLAGITTVAGNVELARTQVNARAIVDMSGRRARVFAGCANPMIVPHEHAKHIHGDTGIPDTDFQNPDCPLDPKHGVDFLIELLEDSDDCSVTLCLVGPLTNLAVVLAKKPHLVRRIKELVIMGGAIALGNTTPAAEYNFYADPHAARVIFDTNLPRVLLPLDTTSSVLFDHGFCDRLEAIGGQAAIFTAKRLRDAGHPRFGGKGRPLHDLCAVGYCLWPELFSGRDCLVEIDDREGLTRGRSIVHYWDENAAPKSMVIDQINAKEFVTRVEGVFAELAAKTA